MAPEQSRWLCPSQCSRTNHGTAEFPTPMQEQSGPPKKGGQQASRRAREAYDRTIERHSPKRAPLFGSLLEVASSSLTVSIITRPNRRGLNMPNRQGLNAPKRQILNVPNWRIVILPDGRLSEPRQAYRPNPPYGLRYPRRSHTASRSMVADHIRHRFGRCYLCGAALSS
jgi:hypothetical protein